MAQLGFHHGVRQHTHTRIRHARTHAGRALSGVLSSVGGETNSTTDAGSAVAGSSRPAARSIGELDFLWWRRARQARSTGRHSRRSSSSIIIKVVGINKIDTITECRPLFSFKLHYPGIALAELYQNMSRHAQSETLPIQTCTIRFVFDLHIHIWAFWVNIAQYIRLNKQIIVQVQVQVFPVRRLRRMCPV